MTRKIAVFTIVTSELASFPPLRWTFILKCAPGNCSILAADPTPDLIYCERKVEYRSGARLDAVKTPREIFKNQTGTPPLLIMSGTGKRRLLHLKICWTLPARDARSQQLTVRGGRAPWAIFVVARGQYVCTYANGPPRQ